MTANQVIAQATAQLKSEGFSKRIVTRDEIEDGIGAEVGTNFIRTENNIPVWYSVPQALVALNLHLIAFNPSKPTQQKEYTTFENCRDWEKWVLSHGAQVEFKMEVK